MTAKVTIKEEANQSSSRPRSSTSSSAPRNVATSRKPTRSKPPCCCSSPFARAVAGSLRIVEMRPIASRPTGPLIRKHHCQEILSDIQPPRVGPTTGATTTATPNTAKAWPRFAGGNASARIDCATGTMPPPPRPCRMRNSKSASRLGANPHSTELRVKSPRQMRKKVLRPNIRARKLEAVRMMALETR